MLAWVLLALYQAALAAHGNDDDVQITDVVAAVAVGVAIGAAADTVAKSTPSAAASVWARIGLGERRTPDSASEDAPASAQKPRTEGTCP